MSAAYSGSVASFFSRSYAEAREKFLAATEASGARLLAPGERWSVWMKLSVTARP